MASRQAWARRQWFDGWSRSKPKTQGARIVGANWLFFFRQTRTLAALCQQFWVGTCLRPHLSDQDRRHVINLQTCMANDAKSKVDNQTDGGGLYMPYLALWDGIQCSLKFRSCISTLKEFSPRQPQKFQAKWRCSPLTAFSGFGVIWCIFAHLAFGQFRIKFDDSICFPFLVSYQNKYVPRWVCLPWGKKFWKSAKKCEKVWKLWNDFAL